MERVKLSVYGITYSEVQSGAYALILAQEDGPYRIPVVVGVSEAQSIAVKLRGIAPKRPLSHDLFTSVAQAFGIRLKEVFISKYEDGVFYSDMKFTDGDREIIIDARTSDAVAAALRSNAPIYTTQEIIEKTGFLLGDHEMTPHEKRATITENSEEVGLERYTVDQLRKMMQKCVDREEYERAAEIKTVIESKLEK